MRWTWPVVSASAFVVAGCVGVVEAAVFVGGMRDVFVDLEPAAVVLAAVDDEVLEVPSFEIRE